MFEQIMPETTFEELKRYVRFTAADEAALRAFAGTAEARFTRVVDSFYARLEEHEQAQAVLKNPEQIARLKGTMRSWLDLFFHGPWDEAYFQLRSRIGRVHVKIALPQRYMFGAMNVIRLELVQIASENVADPIARDVLIGALHKLLDIELAIMLETYREALVDVRTQRAERLAALGTMAAGLAHELRNPLNAAHLQLNVARRRLTRAPSSEAEAAGSAIELAQSEIKRLAGLVDDFLRFAKPQPLRLALVDLRSTAEVIVELMVPEARAAGVALVLEPGVPIMLEMDDEKIKQVLFNLVRNAIEASPLGATVHVRIEARSGSAHLRVEDKGPGVDKDAPVFEPFFTSKEHGTGLGLAIVHRIVMDHGGSVGFESAPGRTVFSISLPTAVASPSINPSNSHR